VTNEPSPISSLLHGAALGLAIAAPIGPTALLCIQRTLDSGAFAGMATGYGAATTHVVFASIAAAGLVVLTDQLAATPGVAMLLQILCAAFLFYLAVKTACRRTPPPSPARSAERPPRPSLGSSYALGLFWTLGNPMTLLGFAALSPGFLDRQTSVAHSLPLLAAGVFAGSAGWWTTLALGVALIRTRLGARGLRLANLTTAISLALVAIGVIAQASGLHADGNLHVPVVAVRASR
jgi:threonine/homoserine/homoserine lactone efflux protein